MTRWIGPFAALIITALAAHWATLNYAPSVIMDRALTALKDRGIAQHAFTSPQRITPQTQAVVRTSPDLFYSLCRFDLSEPGSAVNVTMAEWPGYGSLSFFDSSTNNFLTIRGDGLARSVKLAAPGSSVPGAATSPTARGVVLIRRLAPTQEMFDEAMNVAQSDFCELERP